MNKTQHGDEENKENQKTKYLYYFISLNYGSQF
jgi:hypothetical protein